MAATKGTSAAPVAKAVTKAASSARKAAALAPAKKTTAPAATSARATPAPAKTAKAATKATAVPAKKVATKAAPVPAKPAKKVATKAAPAPAKPAKKAATKAASVPAKPAKKAATKAASVPAKPAKKAATKAAPAPAKLVAVDDSPLPVRADEEPWTEAELKEIRREIERDIARGLADIATAEEDLQGLIWDAGDGSGDDQADAGAKTYEREQEISLANISRDKLAQNRHALERLDNGSYGVCESCGEPIGKFRLQAAPRATLCRSCKEKSERG